MVRICSNSKKLLGKNAIGQVKNENCSNKNNNNMTVDSNMTVCQYTTHQIDCVIKTVYHIAKMIVLPVEPYLAKTIYRLKWSERSHAHQSRGDFINSSLTFRWLHLNRLWLVYYDSEKKTEQTIKTKRLRYTKTENSIETNICIWIFVWKFDSAEHKKKNIYHIKWVMNKHHDIPSHRIASRKMM